MKFSAAGGWFGKSYLDNITAAGQHGFHAIEQLGWLGVDFAAAKARLDEYGMTSTATIIQSVKEENMKLTAWPHGMVWEDSRAAFVESFKESIAAARAMGVPNIIATTGNERSDISRAAQHAICVETLKALAPLAEDAGIQIVLEPLNVLVNHKGYFLVTSAEGFEMIREVGSPNVKLLFDIYHQQISEGNLIPNIVNNIDLIGHFHIADNPGRKEPGTGEINYTNILKAIQQTSYNGYLAFECGRSVDIDPLCANMHALIDPFAD